MCNALLSKCDNDLRPYLVLKALLMSFPFFGEGGGGEELCISMGCAADRLNSGHCKELS